MFTHKSMPKVLSFVLVFALEIGMVHAPVAQAGAIKNKTANFAKSKPAARLADPEQPTVSGQKNVEELSSDMRSKTSDFAQESENFSIVGYVFGNVKTNEKNGEESHPMAAGIPSRHEKTDEESP